MFGCHKMTKYQPLRVPNKSCTCDVQGQKACYAFYEHANCHPRRKALENKMSIGTTPNTNVMNMLLRYWDTALILLRRTTHRYHCSKRKWVAYHIILPMEILHSSSGGPPSIRLGGSNPQEDPTKVKDAFGLGYAQCFTLPILLIYEHQIHFCLLFLEPKSQAEMTWLTICHLVVLPVGGELEVENFISKWWMSGNLAWF